MNLHRISKHGAALPAAPAARSSRPRSALDPITAAKTLTSANPAAAPPIWRARPAFRQSSPSILRIARAGAPFPDAFLALLVLVFQPVKYGFAGLEHAVAHGRA